MNYGNQFINPYMQSRPVTGFIGVQSEQEARSYPVTPGSSVTFRDESSPNIFYTKTVVSQFDAPIFERYKMVKDEPVPAAPAPQIEPSKDKDIDSPVYMTKDEARGIFSQITDLRKDIAWLKNKIKKEAAVNE